MAKPFRFGVQTSKVASRAEWVSLARAVEAHGYSVLTMPDHFSDQLAPVPALMCAADATERLRVGALVWDNDYKHPVVLGKELATMDLLSEGRLELGLGAGWEKIDYDRSGMSYDPPGVRVSRFEEAITVLKGIFSPGPFSFSGTHYTITDYDGLPAPVQQPHPPILVGGGGKRVLSIAGREAQIVGINGDTRAGVIGPDTYASMTADAVDEKVGWVRAAAGDRFDDIELNVRAFLTNVTDDRAATMAGIAGFTGMSVADVEASPFALVGTPAQLVDDLLARRERWGFSYVIVGQADVEAFAPVVAELAGR